MKKFNFKLLAIFLTLSIFSCSNITSEKNYMMKKRVPSGNSQYLNYGEKYVPTIKPQKGTIKTPTIAPKNYNSKPNNQFYNNFFDNSKTRQVPIYDQVANNNLQKIKQNYNRKPRPAISPNKPTIPTLRNIKNFYIQVGVFKLKRNAENVLKRIGNVTTAKIQETKINNIPMYKIRIGPFSNVRDANNIKKHISKKGFRDSIIFQD